MAPRADRHPPEPTASYVPFKFSSCKEAVLVSDPPGTYKETTLEDLIKSTNATGLWQHHQFPAGVPPIAPDAKKLQAFLPSAGEPIGRIASALAAAEGKGSKATLLWFVEVAGGKIKPSGLALYARKQIIVKAVPEPLVVL